jgi:hypothetical protein
LPFTHAGAAANSGFGYNIFPKALNGIAANPANSRPDSESQSASGFISLTALVSDAVKNSSGTAACSDQKSQKSSFKVSACIPASSSETVDSESISNEIASVRAEVHAIKAMLNSQPTPLTGGSREFQLLRQKQDYQTELLLHVLKKLDDVITRVPLPPGVLPSVVEPLPTAPTIDDITVTFVDSPVTVVLPMRKIEELTDFHSQLTGNTRITMVTRLVLKCRDKHESVVDATNAVCEAVFHNELRAKISYFGTGVQIAAKWTQADRDKKFRLSMKEIDTDQRIEDMLSGKLTTFMYRPNQIEDLTHL